MNSPRSSETLEILVHSPPKPISKTPLLFVHGAFTSAWCWEANYLPFFAAAGFEVHAVSLSGHGKSRARAQLDSLSIADYVNDVREAAAAMPAAPVLIGHSMGGFVVQKYLEQYAAPAAVLMCSVPPQGLMSTAVNLMLSRPNLLIELNRMMAGSRDSMDSLREAMFAQPISFDAMRRVYLHAQPESHRALWDMTLFNIPSPSKIRKNLGSGAAGKLPLLVTGTALDQLIPISSIDMTARTYDTEQKIFQGIGHGLMLERDWQKPAGHILAWLQRQLMGEPANNEDIRS